MYYTVVLLSYEIPSMNQKVVEKLFSFLLSILHLISLGMLKEAEDEVNRKLKV